MKTTKILYWVFTVLILGLMLFSAVSTFMMSAAGEKMAADMHYPFYIFKFLAVAKILGIVAILVPGNPRLKEWAYAGFFFDLLGATYSFIAMGSPVAEWLPMLVFFVFLFGSYICYHKISKAKQHNSI
jgi:hypothetical protein